MGGGPGYVDVDRLSRMAVLKTDHPETAAEGGSTETSTRTCLSTRARGKVVSDFARVVRYIPMPGGIQ